MAVRPTSDRTREALFDILEAGRFTEGRSPLPGARVLDAFAGTGALGLEALSRGADEAVFMERYAPALAALRKNIQTLGAGPRTRVLDRDVLHPPSSDAPCDLVFLDPPYNQNLAEVALEALRAAGWIGPNSLIAVEQLKSESFSPPAGFVLLDRRTYGKAALLLLRWEPGCVR